MLRNSIRNSNGEKVFENIKNRQTNIKSLSQSNRNQKAIDKQLASNHQAIK